MDVVDFSRVSETFLTTSSSRTVLVLSSTIVCTRVTRSCVSYPPKAFKNPYGIPHLVFCLLGSIDVLILYPHVQYYVFVPAVRHQTFRSLSFTSPMFYLGVP